MDVDFWGVVNGTKAFLPHLIASGDGHVVNISSMYGLFAVQGQAAYNSAKFAVRGFTEALRQEMEVAGHPVKVTCVHPGYIKTPLVHNASTATDLDTNALAAVFDKVAHHQPRAHGQNHAATPSREQGASAARRRRQAVRPDRAADGFGLHAGARCR